VDREAGTVGTGERTLEVTLDATPEATADFRREFRARHVGPRYSGIAHFAATSAAGAAGIAWLAAGARAVRPVEWLTVPAAFLFANVVEYLAHRGPMHHLRPGARILFERHTRQHHRFYTDEAMAIDSTRDFKIVLFPLFAIALFAGAILAPIYVALRLFVSANVASLFCATALAYYLLYEWLHLAYHLPADSPVGRLPAIRLLRRHHARHHDPRKMTAWNFNVTFPLADALFGTWYREPRSAASDS
jgi:sterol desaturase/sphingolipid hydroxylase (fatty acid hydroxylase superfamily)